jgi:hypothetical protein
VSLGFRLTESVPFALQAGYGVVTYIAARITQIARWGLLPRATTANHDAGLRPVSRQHSPASIKAALIRSEQRRRRRNWSK